MNVDEFDLSGIGLGKVSQYRTPTDWGTRKSYLVSHPRHAPEWREYQTYDEAWEILQELRASDPTTYVPLHFMWHQLVEITASFRWPRHWHHVVSTHKPYVMYVGPLSSDHSAFIMAKSPLQVRLEALHCGPRQRGGKVPKGLCFWEIRYKVNLEGSPQDLERFDAILAYRSLINRTFHDHVGYR